MVVAILGLLTLTGCNAAGTVDVRSASEVVIDLSISNFSGDGYSCSDFGFQSRPQLTVTDVRDSSGLVKACRLQGTLPPEWLTHYVTIASVGEYVRFEFNPLGIGPGSQPTESPYYGQFPAFDGDVTITFPGRVLSSTGDADGNSVRFHDSDQFQRAYGWQATALNHAGPEWALVGPIAGVAVGLGIAAAFRWARRRARGSGVDVDRADPDEAMDEAAPADRAAQPGDGTPSPTEAEPLPAGDAWAPRRDEPAAAPTPPTTASTDPSRWAPPD